MDNLLRELLKSFLHATEPLHPYWPHLLAAAIALALLIRYGVGSLLQLIERLRTRTSRHHFKVKQALLANAAITELYAPYRNHTHERSEEEEQKPVKKNAWLSPYPRAVKASYKRNRLPKNEVLDARKQIKDAASHIQVCPLPEAETYGDPKEHYLIKLDLDGNAPAQVSALAPRIQSQLGLAAIEETPSGDTYTVAFTAHKTKPRDRLAELALGGEFFDQHPAKDPYKLPLAATEAGRTWALPTHHTIIYGATGSGKGSPLNGSIRQLAPHIDNGIVQLFGIDPKRTELLPYDGTTLFQNIAYTTPEAQQLIWQVHQIMQQRAQSKTVNYATGDLGRDLPASKQYPATILIIDELLSLLTALLEEGRAGKTTHGLLVDILAKGRSLGVFIIAATQSVDTQLLGRMRINFANAIVLRQDSEYFNDFFLGADAAKNGYNSTAIPPSNKANGYRYSGIGFVKEESGLPIKVRFAYCSDQDIAALCASHQRPGGGGGVNLAKPTQPTGPGPAPATTTGTTDELFNSGNEQVDRMNRYLADLAAGKNPPSPF